MDAENAIRLKKRLGGARLRSGSLRLRKPCEKEGEKDTGKCEGHKSHRGRQGVKSIKEEYNPPSPTRKREGDREGGDGQRGDRVHLL